ncbi:WSC domain-containing protein [Psilocybe cubensis]|uniref:WSC domain-containing protein n=2 Tax=Psilocybe cubensis TaxID=181762 RepID=A0ACB8H8X6_PSICU|nr:WSC domain-containing protein [Psilocybe cubensis]KAH9484458.1 WSC domain-containing protein [Psilocybe cubensis]
MLGRSSFCALLFAVILYYSPGAVALVGASSRELGARQTENPVFLGCFADGSPRILRHGAGSNLAETSFASCADTCFQAGYALAGVENGHECYCGNAFLYDYGTSTGCTSPCPGDASNTCGGPGAMQVYSTGAGPYTTGPASFVLTYNGWNVTECWEDGVGGRTLPHTPTNNPPSASMTVEKCIDACAADGYTSAGLEWGQ